MEQFPIGLMIVVFLGISILSSSIRILREYERGVVFRLGRLMASAWPGYHIFNSCNR